jgi:aspartyl-tRNA(Asn)/glutamyl-tRNA(Gln) amidotransferase subunit A
MVYGLDVDENVTYVSFVRELELQSSHTYPCLNLGKNYDVQHQFSTTAGILPVTPSSCSIVPFSVNQGPMPPGALRTTVAGDISAARRAAVRQWLARSQQPCISTARISRSSYNATWRRRFPYSTVSSPTDSQGVSDNIFVPNPTAKGESSTPAPIPESEPARPVDGRHPAFRLAVKDNIAVAGVPLTCASAILGSYTPQSSATIVTQLRARGARVVGKSNLDEFGMGSHNTHSHFGTPTSKPPGRSPGGSSGGSAVAIARGEADVALGTDTGGSVRLPAAWNGVVGFKPSYGLLSRHGVVPYANSLDTVGLLARAVAPIFDLLFGEAGLGAEHDPKDPTSLAGTKWRHKSLGKRASDTGKTGDKPLSGLTLGLPLEYNIAELSPAVRAAWSATASLLERAGAAVVPVSLPHTRHALSAYYVIAPAEALSNLAKYDGVRYGARDPGARDDADGEGREGVLYAATRGRGFGAEAARRILLGSYTLSARAMDNHFVQAQRVRRLVRRDFDRAFKLSNPLVGAEERQFDLTELPEGVELADKKGPAQVDLLLCPTAPTGPPRLDELDAADPVAEYMNDVFTVPASLAGLPAISLPVRAGDAEAGNMGVGMQLIGQYWDDGRVLRVAQQVEDLLVGSNAEEFKKDTAQGA